MKVKYHLLRLICACVSSCIIGSKDGINIIRTDLCDTFCLENALCIRYKTPVSDCYNGEALFPNDPSWGPYDVEDDVMDKFTFVRKFYASENGTCRDQTDQFELPFNVCVGPFGQPRPWGKFALIQVARSNDTLFMQIR